MLKGYLAGPIAGCTDAEANDWRELVKSKVSDIEWLDPMDRDFRNYGTLGKTNYDIVNHGHNYNRLPADVVQTIVHGDKRCIDESDVILYNCWKPGWGTAMEMLYAFEHGKLNIAVANGHVSPWIRYHADVVFDTLEEAIDYLHEHVLTKGAVL